jgi:hypothetical protein
LLPSEQVIDWYALPARIYPARDLADAFSSNEDC